MIDLIIVTPFVLALAVLGLLSIKTFTLVGFHQEEARSGLTKVAALADEHVTVSLDDITVPELNRIMGAYFFSKDIVAAQLNSPSLRRLIQPDFHPLEASDSVDDHGETYHDFKENPLTLVRSEKINALIDSGAGVEHGVVLLWLTDAPVIPVGGEIRTIKATLVDVTATYAWTNGALTLSQTLPAGRYQVVGMTVDGTNARDTLAARLVFVGGTWRPGVLGNYTIGGTQPRIFRQGLLGSWGEFEFDQPPTVDILCRGATGVIDVFLDLVQVREGR